MAALGRILQIAGWLWVILGFAGSFFGFLSLSFVPGIILVFIARIIRNQAARQEIPELEGSDEEPEPVASPPERMMNTERQRQAERSSPEPAVVEIERQRDTSLNRNQLLGQIVSAGRETVEEEVVAEHDLDEPVDTGAARKPMSSAEMIARAHERWDSKPR